MSSCNNNSRPFITSSRPVSGMSGVARIIYSEEYFARSSDGQTQTSVRNMTITKAANNVWTATLTSAHPDGVDYHVSITPHEQFANRDGVIAQVVQGTKTANGFDFMLLTGDNGLSPDDINVIAPFTIGIDSPITVLVNV